MSKTLLAAAFATLFSTTILAKTQIQWWHAMGGSLEKNLQEITDGFNKSQNDYEIIPVNKGSYADTMTAAISAFRAKQQPAIVQVYEVGTATMMAAKGAIYPVEDLFAKYGEKLDKSSYLPAVIAYYQTPEGKLLSMPFNSSSVVMWYNKDAMKKAGVEHVPTNWSEMDAAGKKFREAGYECGYTFSWQSWVMIENYSAWNDIAMGTKEDGFAGFDAEFTFNNDHVINRLQTIKDSGNFVYGGRRSDSTSLFINQKCPIWLGSSGSYSGIKEQAKFAFGAAPMPYDDAFRKAPQNSIIGGATLWVLQGKSDEEYKGTAAFLKYLSQPEIQKRWHEETGYVPITTAAYELAKKEGYYDKLPDAEVAVKELSLNQPTVNSRGIRFGNYPQVRDVINTEMENIWSGKKTAKQAMDDAVAKGNELLRQFEKSVK